MTTRLLHHADVTVDRNCIIRRRDFLRGVSLTGLAAGMLGWKDLVSLQADELRRRGMSCILLWMQGGPSHFETFSPKPEHANGGETKAISTSVPGIEIADNFPLMAKVMQDAAIIRSMTSKEGSHPRATYLMHTGYSLAPAVKYPAFGAIAAQQIQHEGLELPAFVRVGNLRGTADGGFLGVEHDPFVLSAAGKLPANVKPTTDADRYRRRLGLLERLELSDQGGAKQEVADHLKLYHRSSAMILGNQMKAFDLEQEPASMREAYGSGPFASGCLLARRLVEAGVTFVEVELSNWDTHGDNFAKVRKLAGQVDQPFAQLISDLKQRGMLDSTLVVWMGEFGRTPKINPKGGRDHYPRTSNVVLAGGGVRGGQFIGKTDESGAEVADRPVTVPDLFQSFCKTLKINADVENMTGGRPIKIVEGGQPVAELFA
jgi:hypothetical protein